MAPRAWARAVERPFTFSWFQRETVAAPRTWWDRLRFRRKVPKPMHAHLNYGGGRGEWKDIYPAPVRYCAGKAPPL